MASSTTFNKILINKDGEILGLTEVVNDTVMSYGGRSKYLREACRSDHLIDGGVVDCYDNKNIIFIERRPRAMLSVKLYLDLGFELAGWGKVNGVEVYNLIARTPLLLKGGYMIGEIL